MYRRKLLIVVISLAALLVTLFAQDTIAYYSVLGESTSVITSGEISIRIVERMGNKEIGDEGIYLMPGTVYSKKLSVQNNGENPCWLRIKLTNGIDDESLSADVLELDINQTDWILGEDGYYYYNSILQPNTETEPLFNQMRVAGSTDNSYIGRSLKLTVNAYAVQSENNDNVSSPLEVVGWPAES